MKDCTSALPVPVLSPLDVERKERSHSTSVALPTYLPHYQEFLPSSQGVFLSSRIAGVTPTTCCPGQGQATRHHLLPFLSKHKGGMPRLLPWGLVSRTCLSILCNHVMCLSQAQHSMQLITTQGINQDIKLLIGMLRVNSRPYSKVTVLRMEGNAFQGMRSEMCNTKRAKGGSPHFC